jgi:hypothetical protein
MLKAAYARSLPGDPPETINVDLGYLLLEDKCDAVLLNWFQRREPEVTPILSYRTDWGLVILLVVMLAFFGLTIVGVVSTLNWLRSF